MGMDARRVLLFRDVVRAGSLSAAARELGWTQPAVSQQLQRLEREAGCPLLVRGPRGVTPTEAGVALLARADTVAGELRLAQEEVDARAQLRAGRVRLVAFPSAAATIAPGALAGLTAAHPGVEVSMGEAEPPEALAAVRADEADLALVFGYDGPPADLRELRWTTLVVEPVHLVDREGAPPRGLADLADEPWIAGCVRCRTHLVERCEAAGFSPQVRYESDDYVMVQHLVARGLGVTLLPASALAAYRHPGVSVREDDLGERHVGLVHRHGADRVPAIGALRDALVGAIVAT